jgi:amidase
MPVDDHCFLPAHVLAEQIRTRHVSAREVMEAHLRQIEQINPQVNAIVTLLPEQALAQADAADAQIARGDLLGALHGLPIAHKDLVETRGIRTTYGSPIYRDHVPDVDALIVERLRAAGAITIGKTNTPEFGAGSQTFNPVFGATHNPYDLGRTCGGSSGGAAVALACGMLPIADGSDMGGSLRNPAGYCNVVGLRPSPGRVPSWPSRTSWSPLSVEGPMARTVRDVALLLSVLAGPDPRVPLSISEAGARFATTLDADLRGLRIAWSRDLGGLPIDPEVARVIDAQRATFEALGCAIDDATPDLTDADTIFKIFRAWHFELGLGELLTTQREQLKDTVIWNIEQGQKLSGAELGWAEKARTELHQRMIDFFGRYDVLITVVSQVPPFAIDQPYVTEINGVKLDNYIDWMRSCYLISATGLPALSVPCGFTASGLPVGLQLVGGWRDEWRILQLAHAFEQATGFWQQRPSLVNSQ